MDPEKSTFSIARCTKARAALVGRLIAEGVPPKWIDPVPEPRDVIECSGVLVSGRLLSGTQTAEGASVWVLGGPAPESTLDGPLTMHVSLSTVLAELGVSSVAAAS